jgi:hypothetical protein
MIFLAFHFEPAPAGSTQSPRHCTRKQTLQFPFFLHGIKKPSGSETHCSRTQHVRNLRTALWIIDIFLLDGSFEITAIPDMNSFFCILPNILHVHRPCLAMWSAKISMRFLDWRTISKHWERRNPQIFFKLHCECSVPTSDSFKRLKTHNRTPDLKSGAKFEPSAMALRHLGFEFPKYSKKKNQMLQWDTESNNQMTATFRIASTFNPGQKCTPSATSRFRHKQKERQLFFATIVSNVFFERRKPAQSSPARCDPMQQHKQV